MGDFIRSKFALRAVLALAVVFAALPAPRAVEAAPAEPVRFGMEAASVDLQVQAGVKPDYGVIWVGPWTLTSGWGGPDDALRKMAAAEVTPVVQFYYWGDDISPTCVEDGCWSNLHNTWKDKGGWGRLAAQLTEHLRSTLGDRRAVIVLETEFNKGGAQTYEPLDGYLADKAKFLREKFPTAHVVLGFGNWGQNNWNVFDRAAAASDAVGIQGMRGSTRDSRESYLGLADALQSGVRGLRDRFAKPIFVTDVALSSYPEPEYLDLQTRALRTVLDRLPALREDGVTGLIYRSLRDATTKDTKNYYGEAERHFGLVWTANGTWKPAMKDWVAAVGAARGIADNDAEPTIAFAGAASKAPESAGPAVVTVVLGAPSGRTVTVGYGFSGGTAAGGGKDFRGADGTLVFEPGATRKRVPLEIVPDDIPEADETIVISLRDPTYARLAKPSVRTHTIVDDDSVPTVTLSLSGGPVLGAGGEAKLTAALSGPFREEVSAKLVFSGTAERGEDYKASAETLVFPVRET